MVLPSCQRLGGSDISMFIYHVGEIHLILLVYVEDIVLTGNSSSAVDDLVITLGREFSLKDLGPLHFFLGIDIALTGNS